MPLACRVRTKISQRIMKYDKVLVIVRSSPRGSWCGKLNGEKKWTPAIPVPQVRDGIAMLLRAACLRDTPTQVANDKTRRLTRNEEARFYHYKARNRLPPLRINQRR
jgi:hypothetical protein